MPIKRILSEAERKMDDTVEHTRRELAAIRTGRASLAILDGITVEYYGAPTPLQQVCSLSIPEATLIVAQPWDATLIKAIEKAILASGLGLNPSNDGKVVRIPIPPLTEERRRQLARRVHEIAEQGRTAVRLERRAAKEALKKLLKDKAVSEDDERRALDQVQEATDRHVERIDGLSKAKDEEILKV
ncbi:MAG: ribosome recycling factor [Acidobacteriota bacterium]